MSPSPLDLAADLAAELDRLNVPYVLGGSLASSLFGEPRSTVDVDVAVRLDSEHLAALTESLSESFYVPRASAAQAVAEHSSFNLIHVREAAKFDLFVLGDGLLDTNQLRRRIWVEVRKDPALGLWVTSPEDQVLRKLSWFRLGGESSDRQWRDVIAILRTQRGHLDEAYLISTAAQIGLDELLRRAHDAASNAAQ